PRPGSPRGLRPLSRSRSPVDARMSASAPPRLVFVLGGRVDRHLRVLAVGPINSLTFPARPLAPVHWISLLNQRINHPTAHACAAGRLRTSPDAQPGKHRRAARAGSALFAPSAGRPITSEATRI